MSIRQDETRQDTSHESFMLRSYAPQMFSYSAPARDFASRVAAHIWAVGALTTLALLLPVSSPCLARDYIRAGGSATVYPYAKIVAEAFAKQNPKISPPAIEAGGTVAGFEKFCGGTGEDQIDIATASRRMKKAERDVCALHGAGEIVEVKFGYDGIVFATDIKAPNFAFDARDIYLALAPEIPQGTQLIANPYVNWRQVNEKLPDVEIAIILPSQRHGTRDVFEEKVLIPGCRAAGAAALIEQRLKAQGLSREKLKDAGEKECSRVRSSGPGLSVEQIDGDYSQTLSRLEENRKALAVLGLAFFENNTEKLKVASMSGVRPSLETVSDGRYPVTRPLYFYIKKAQLGFVSSLNDFAELFVSDAMIGEDGPLVQYGLVPLTKNEAKDVRETVRTMKPINDLTN